MAQMTAPESIVRAILAARPSLERTRVLAALGLADDGSPCTEGQRATALAELVGGEIPPAPELPDIAPPTPEDEELPF
jgi:hypothetical protein